jgi:hypothetical protein
MTGAAPIRGQQLLLAHCASLDVPDEELRRGVDRLAEAVGSHLAWVLVFALTGDGRSRAREFAG